MPQFKCRNGVFLCKDGKITCCCCDCPDCCTWNGTINLPGGGTTTFGGMETGHGGGAYGHCFMGIFPFCDNVGLVQDIPAPASIFTQDPVGNPGDPCHEEDAFMEVLTWCSFVEGVDDEPVFHLTHAIYVEDPANPGEYICCQGPNDCSFECDPEQFPYTQAICDGFEAVFE